MGKKFLFMLKTVDCYFSLREEKNPFANRLLILQSVNLIFKSRYIKISGTNGNKFCFVLELCNFTSVQSSIKNYTISPSIYKVVPVASKHFRSWAKALRILSQIFRRLAEAFRKRNKTYTRYTRGENLDYNFVRSWVICKSLPDNWKANYLVPRKHEELSEITGSLSKVSVKFYSLLIANHF